MKFVSICRLLLASSILLFGHLLFAADGYVASSIPVDLMKNAYAVVRENSSEFVQTDQNNGKYKEKLVITILDKRGEDYANFVTSCDKFRELDSFSGVIYDASGKVVKKIKKGDLTRSSINWGITFASDDYTLYYECKQPIFPYTVEYTMQYKLKGGIISYFPFSPYPGFNASVERADYRLEIPESIQLRSKTTGGLEVKKSAGEGRGMYNIAVQNLNAISSEPNCPPSRDLFPRVFLAPSDFCFDGVCGNMADWKNYGLWVNELLKGRDELPAAVVAKINELTANAKTDREKVEVLYDFLQKNNRYVSIQLGIGGFQPIHAASVFKNRLGDCKGLSNLMRAMLKGVGIESNYCEIGVQRSDLLFQDFANVSQTDHVILLVPLKNDSIWLECTSPVLPFGFVHDGIAGHDAVVISNDGGKLCRLPTYSEKENLTTSVVKMELKEDGNVAGTMAIEDHLFNYDYSIGYLRDRDREKVVKYANAKMSLPKMELGDYTVAENKSSRPSVLFEGKFNAPGYINKTGARLFVPICPLQKGQFNRFSASERFLDIDLRYGYTDQDTVVFTIPDGFVIESLPKDVIEETKYGVLKTHAEKIGNTVVYTQTIVMHKGLFPKEEYAEIKAFFQKINGALKQKMVLKKDA